MKMSGDSSLGEYHMATERARLLLVDDSAVLRRLAAVTLTSIGIYEVDEARDAFEALELMLANDYGAILTDYYMPGIDGIEFVRRLRRLDQWSRTPVVMISTERDPYVEREAKDAGVDDFIIKPFEPGRMREVLDRLLEHETRTPYSVDAQALLDSMPYPAMVLDRNHSVVLGNTAFWTQTGSGMDDTGVRCTEAMHGSGHAPANCPLTAAVASGMPVEEEIVGNGAKTRVSVYPMSLLDDQGQPLYLHLARPLHS